MRTITLFILLLSFFYSSFAQNTTSDLALISSQDFSVTHPRYYHKHKVSFMQPKSKNVFVRYNPVSLTLGTTMFFYQKVISRQFSAQCIYEPSCSNFSKQSIAEFGFFKGIFLSADRLTRCNRISALDADPLSLNLKSGHFKDNPSKYHISDL